MPTIEEIQEQLDLEIKKNVDLEKNMQDSLAREKGANAKMTEVNKLLEEAEKEKLAILEKEKQNLSDHDRKELEFKELKAKMDNLEKERHTEKILLEKTLFKREVETIISSFSTSKQVPLELLNNFIVDNGNIEDIKSSIENFCELYNNSIEEKINNSIIEKSGYKPINYNGNNNNSNSEKTVLVPKGR